MARATALQSPPAETALPEIERYRDNWVRHLLGITEDLDRRVVARLASEGGYEQLRPNLGPFLSSSGENRARSRSSLDSSR